MSGKTKSLRSPLGKVRGLGSSKSGTQQWINLRMTSVVLVPLTLYVLIGFVNNAVSGGYSGAIYWLQSPLSAAFTILMLLVGLHHGAAGMREVIEDYIHQTSGKIVSLLVVYFTAATLAVLGTLSVAKIFFGV
jgi:succinate dehydrogenase / fumarate reductase membrane anchor subunit